MIVVEGPDGAGKTTLVRRLREDTGLPLLERASTSEDGPKPNMREWVNRDLLQARQGIHDRHPLISEPIYGPLTRHRMQSGFDDVYWLLGVMTKFYLIHRPLIIYCLPPWVRVLDNIKKNHSGDTEHTAQVLLYAEPIYHQYLAKLAMDSAQYSGVITQWDYTQNAGDANYQSLLELVKADERELRVV